MTAVPFPIQQDQTGPLPGCVTIRLEQPGSPVIVLDQSLIQRLEVTFRALPSTTTGLVLASASEKVFIAGADLKAIDLWPDGQLNAYLAHGAMVFGMLADLPFPTVAAINGAALGGGLEIAMYCDGLVAAPSPTGTPYPIGLPEASLCICPGWGGTNLLPARLDPMQAIRMTAEGKTIPFDTAAKTGLFDRLAPTSSDLLVTAKSWLAERRASGGLRRDGAPLRWIGRPDRQAATLAAFLELKGSLAPTDAARAVYRAIEAGLEHGWKAALEIERRELVRLRSMPAGRAAIKVFFERTSKSR
jgi:enoyl-CoA hydratase/carnithine racemase